MPNTTMNNEANIDGKKPPQPSRFVAVAVCLLLTTSIGAIVLDKYSRSQTPAVESVLAVTPTAVRRLSFEDLPNGSVRVSDAQAQSVVQIIPAGEGSFVRGVLRALTRERRMQGIGQQEAFELAVHPVEGLALTDLATGRRLVLNAFGVSNVAVFEEFLLPEQRANKPQAAVAADLSA